MKNYILPIICLFILCSAGNKTQEGSEVEKLICQKWYLEKYAEEDQEPISVPDFLKDNYTEYFKDGSMASLENGVEIHGNWTYNSATKQLTGTQTENPDYPAEVTVEIIEISANKMVVKGIDAGGSVLTLYLYSK